ncbi:unnamed protein product [Closterium sp. NIES-54]
MEGVKDVFFYLRHAPDMCSCKSARQHLSDSNWSYVAIGLEEPDQHAIALLPCPAQRIITLPCPKPRAAALPSAPARLLLALPMRCPQAACALPALPARHSHAACALPALPACRSHAARAARTLPALPCAARAACSLPARRQLPCALHCSRCLALPTCALPEPPAHYLVLPAHRLLRCLCRQLALLPLRTAYC